MNAVTETGAQVKEPPAAQVTADTVRPVQAEQLATGKLEPTFDTVGNDDDLLLKTSPQLMTPEQREAAVRGAAGLHVHALDLDTGPRIGPLHRVGNRAELGAFV